MPMDALCLSAVLRETEQAVVGGRIDKIHQPTRDEVLLHIRSRNGACRLVLTANPSWPRMQLTDLPRENPAEPPMFCMLLRKYLAGGKILEVKQPPMERLAELVIEASNEMGDKVTRCLILEAMGRRTNLVLLDGEGRIVDCLKRVDVDITQENARPLLPGMFYKYPPSQPGKLDPSALTGEDRAQLLAAGQCDTPADRFLLDHFVGLTAVFLIDYRDATVFGGELPENGHILRIGAAVVYDDDLQLVDHLLGKQTIHTATQVGLHVVGGNTETQDFHLQLHL